MEIIDKYLKKILDSMLPKPEEGGKTQEYETYRKILEYEIFGYLEELYSKAYNKGVKTMKGNIDEYLDEDMLKNFPLT